jgi:DNA primase catalytic subunit
MATDKTQTYGKAKMVFTTLGLKEDLFIDMDVDDLPTFRKHLSEMIKRQKSNNLYATRISGKGIKVVRIQ